MEFWPMASVQAGVVGEAEVNGLPTQPGKAQLALSDPATWSYIWVLVAFIYLVGIYLGMIRISRKG
jgi:hypothetical protein